MGMSAEVSADSGDSWAMSHGFVANPEPLALGLESLFISRGNTDTCAPICAA